MVEEEEEEEVEVEGEDANYIIMRSERISIEELYCLNDRNSTYEKIGLILDD